MRKLPTSINILGTEFEVKVHTPLGVDADCGTSEQHIRLIQIDAALPLDAQWETLYHETVHMLLKHIGLSHLIDDKVEEAIAQGLGVGLLYVVAANPDMAQFNKAKEGSDE